MPGYPKLTGTAAKVPLSINPENGKLIYYEDIDSGREKIVLVDELTQDQKKKLVIARIKAQPGFTQTDLNGSQLSQKELVSQIKKEEGEGARFVESDISYLKDFLPQFKK